MKMGSSSRLHGSDTSCETLRNANRLSYLRALGILWMLIALQTDVFPQASIHPDLRIAQSNTPSYPWRFNPSGMREADFDHLHSQQADSNLKLVGEWAWGTCTTVALSGNVAFIGSGRSILALDISNPD